MLDQTTSSNTFFTLDEANALVPELQDAFERILQMRMHARYVQRRIDALEAREAEQHSATEAMARAEQPWPLSEDPGPELDELIDRAMLDGLMDEMQEIGERIESSGVRIMDIDPPLVDLRARRDDDEEIFLCWEFGQPEIRWWHGVHEGVEDRRSIDELGAEGGPE
jgi:hypothetical protein